MAELWFWSPTFTPELNESAVNETRQLCEIIFNENLDSLAANINKDNIDKLNEFGLAPIHYACKYEKYNIMKYLLEHGANCNLKDCNDRTPLHYAVHHRSTKIVELLYEHDAITYIDDKFENICVTYAYTFSKTVFEYIIAKFPCYAGDGQLRLCETYKESYDLMSLFDLTYLQMKFSTMQWSTEEVIDYVINNFDEKFMDMVNFKPLMKMVSGYDYEKFFQHLMVVHLPNINKMSDNQVMVCMNLYQNLLGYGDIDNTLVQRKINNLSVGQYIMENGLCIQLLEYIYSYSKFSDYMKFMDEHNLNDLQYAISNKLKIYSDYLINLLTRREPARIKKFRDDSENNFVHLVLMYNVEDTPKLSSYIRKLLDSAPSLIITQNSNNQSPIDIAKQFETPESIIKLLSNYKEEFERTQQQVQKPIFRHEINRNLTKVKLSGFENFLKTLDATDTKYDLYWYESFQKQHLKTNEEMERYENDDINLLKVLLNFSEMEDDTILLYRMIDNVIDPNRRDKNGWTPLFHLVSHFKDESFINRWLDNAIVRLIENKADYTVHDYNGRNLLHVMAIYGANEKILEMFFEFVYVFPNQRDNFGKTPIHYAIEHAQFQVFERMAQLEKRKYFHIIKENEGFGNKHLYYDTHASHLYEPYDPKNITLQNNDTIKIVSSERTYILSNMNPNGVFETFCETSGIHLSEYISIDMKREDQIVYVFYLNEKSHVMIVTTKSSEFNENFTIANQKVCIRNVNSIPSDTMIIFYGVLEEDIESCQSFKYHNQIKSLNMVIRMKIEITELNFISYKTFELECDVQHDLYAKDNDGNFGLHLAFMQMLVHDESKFEPITREYLGFSFCNDANHAGLTPFNLACRHGLKNIADFMITYNKEILQCEFRKSFDLATDNWHFDIIKLLLDNDIENNIPVVSEINQLADHDVISIHFRDRASREIYKILLQYIRTNFKLFSLIVLNDPECENEEYASNYEDFSWFVDLSQKLFNKLNNCFLTNDLKFVQQFLVIAPNMKFVMMHLLQSMFMNYKSLGIAISKQMEYEIQEMIISEKFMVKESINTNYLSPKKKNKHQQKDNTLNQNDNIQMRISILKRLVDQLDTQLELDDKYFNITLNIEIALHSLKKLKIKTVLPFEELEFLVHMFYRIYRKNYHDHDIVYQLLLHKSDLIEFLKRFIDDLEIENENSTTDVAINNGVDCSKKYLRDSSSSYSKLFDVFEKTRSYHSLSKMLYFMNKSNLININDNEINVLMIQRTIQMVGEYIKNTPESPNFSDERNMELRIHAEHLDIILKNIRNHLSTAPLLKNVIEIEKNKKFFQTIQNDIYHLRNFVIDLMYKEREIFIRKFLRDILQISDIDKLNSLFLNISTTMNLQNTQVSNLHKINILIGVLKSMLRDKSKEEEIFFEKIDFLLSISLQKLSETTEADDLLEEHLEFNFFDPHLFILNTKDDMSSVENSNILRLNKLPRKSEEPFQLLAYFTLQLLKLIEMRQYLYSDKINEIGDEILRTCLTGVYERLVIRFQNDNGFAIKSDTVDKVMKIEPPKTENDIKELSICYRIRLETLQKLYDQIDIKTEKGLVEYDDSTIKLAFEFVVLNLLETLDCLYLFVRPSIQPIYEHCPILFGKHLRNYLAHYDYYYSNLPFDVNLTVLITGKRLLEFGEISNFGKISRPITQDEPDLNIPIYDLYESNIRNIEKQHQSLNKYKSETIGFIATLFLVQSSFRESTYLNETVFNYGLKNNPDKFIDHFMPDYPGRNPEALQIITKYFEIFLRSGRSAPRIYSLNDEAIQSVNNLLCKHERRINKIINLLKVCLIHGLTHRIDGICQLPCELAIDEALKLFYEFLMNTADIFYYIDHIKPYSRVFIPEFDPKYSLVHLACNFGHLKVLNSLFEKSGQNVDILKDDKCNNKKQPIHMACQLGHYNIVKYLLEKGVDPMALTSSNKTPLHYASEGGHTEIINLLLTYDNVCIDAVSSTQKTALDYAFSRNQYDAVGFLIELNAEFTKGTEFLKMISNKIINRSETGNKSKKVMENLAVSKELCVETIEPIAGPSGITQNEEFVQIPLHQEPNTLQDATTTKKRRKRKPKKKKTNSTEITVEDVYSDEDSEPTAVG